MAAVLPASPVKSYMPGLPPPVQSGRQTRSGVSRGSGTCVLVWWGAGAFFTPGLDRAVIERHWDGVGCWSPHTLLHILLHMCKVWKGTRGR